MYEYLDPRPLIKVLRSCSVLINVIILFTGELNTYTFLVTASAILGKFGIAASFSIIHIFSAELFPTVVR